MEWVRGMDKGEWVKEMDSALSERVRHRLRRPAGRSRWLLCFVVTRRRYSDSPSNL